MTGWFTRTQRVIYCRKALEKSKKIQYRRPLMAWHVRRRSLLEQTQKSNQKQTQTNTQTTKHKERIQFATDEVPLSFRTRVRRSKPTTLSFASVGQGRSLPASRRESWISALRRG